MKLLRTSAENGPRTIFAAGFLAFVALFACLLVPKLGSLDIRGAVDDFPAKKRYVELNGACCRLVGRRLCNGVVKTDDGMLVKSCAPRLLGQDVAAARFADWLRAQGVEYVYVQFPAKMDLRLEMRRPCMVHSAYRTVDVLLKGMAQGGVETMDLREELAADPDLVRRFFYRTDHHWNNDAVFRAFTRIAARLGHEVKESDWTRTVVPQCFLGSEGRRTGRLFSGLDDMILYRPGFATEMSLDIPSARIHLVGDFERTNMRNASRIRSGKTDVQAYSQAYVGEISPIVRHHNEAAPVRRRVLVIGDSFVRPLEAFLSTTVTDLLVVDPRRYRNGTIADCVRTFKPDIVLQTQNPSVLSARGEDDEAGESSGRPLFFTYGVPASGRSEISRP